MTADGVTDNKHNTPTVGDKIVTIDRTAKVHNTPTVGDKTKPVKGEVLTITITVDTYKVRNTMHVVNVEDNTMHMVHVEDNAIVGDKAGTIDTAGKARNMPAVEHVDDEKAVSEEESAVARLAHNTSHVGDNTAKEQSTVNMTGNTVMGRGSQHPPQEKPETREESAAGKVHKTIHVEGQKNTVIPTVDLPRNTAEGKVRTTHHKKRTVTGEESSVDTLTGYTIMDKVRTIRLDDKVAMEEEYTVDPRTDAITDKVHNTHPKKRTVMGEESAVDLMTGCTITDKARSTIRLGDKVATEEEPTIHKTGNTAAGKVRTTHHKKRTMMGEESSVDTLTGYTVMDKVRTIHPGDKVATQEECTIHKTGNTAAGKVRTTHHKKRTVTGEESSVDTLTGYTVMDKVRTIRLDDKVATEEECTVDLARNTAAGKVRTTHHKKRTVMGEESAVDLMTGYTIMDKVRSTIRLDDKVATEEECTIDPRTDAITDKVRNTPTVDATKTILGQDSSIDMVDEVHDAPAAGDKKKTVTGEKESTADLVGNGVKDKVHASLTVVYKKNSVTREVTDKIRRTNHDYTPMMAWEDTVKDKARSPTDVDDENTVVGVESTTTHYNAVTVKVHSTIRVVDQTYLVMGKEPTMDLACNAAMDKVHSTPTVDAMPMRWPGDFHPVSDWAPHLLMGGILPSALPSLEDRLFVVCPHPVSPILPWDFAGTGGQPTPGDRVAIPITNTPDHDLTMTASVNGVGVSGSAAAGSCALTYATPVGDDAWPWTALNIDVSAVDSDSLESHSPARVVVGSAFGGSASQCLAAAAVVAVAAALLRLLAFTLPFPEHDAVPAASWNRVSPAAAAHALAVPGKPIPSGDSQHANVDRCLGCTQGHHNPCGLAARAAVVGTAFHTWYASGTGIAAGLVQAVRSGLALALAVLLRPVAVDTAVRAVWWARRVGVLLASRRRFVGVILLLSHGCAVAATSPACARHTSAPNAVVVDVCAPPWPRTPTEVPSAGTSVTIDLVVASVTTGLTAAAAAVNGADVAASFLESGGEAYTLTYPTQPGDEGWPWTGRLDAAITLLNGSVVAEGSALLVIACAPLAPQQAVLYKVDTNNTPNTTTVLTAVTTSEDSRPGDLGMEQYSDIAPSTDEVSACAPRPLRQAVLYRVDTDSAPNTTTVPTMVTQDGRHNDLSGKPQVAKDNRRSELGTEQYSGDRALSADEVTACAPLPLRQAVLYRVDTGSTPNPTSVPTTVAKDTRPSDLSGKPDSDDKTDSHYRTVVAAAIALLLLLVMLRCSALRTTLTPAGFKHPVVVTPAFSTGIFKASRRLTPSGCKHHRNRLTKRVAAACFVWYKSVTTLACAAFLRLATAATAVPARRASALRGSWGRVLVSVLLLSSATATSPACTRLTSPPNDVVVDVCAPPWPRTPTEAPSAGTPVTIDVVVVSGTTGLSASSAVVNGVNVAASFSESGGGAYTLTYSTQAGDVEWPWTGLAVAATLTDGSVVAVVSAVVVAGATWSEESDARGMIHFANRGRGICLSDVDSNGGVDVFVAMYPGGGSLNQLWMNSGSGWFVDEAVTRGVAGLPSDSGFGCTFGDADNNGHLDLLLTRHADEVNDLYINTGAGWFVEEGLARGVRVGNSSRGASWGDFDGDGDLDLYVCNEVGGNMGFVNDGTGVFVDQAAVLGIASTGNCRQAVVFDVDGQGALDILVSNYASVPAIEVYVNTGDGFSEEAAERGFVQTSTGGVGVGIGDFNGDGAVDVYVCTDQPQDWMYVNDGGGLFVYAASGVSEHSSSTGTVMVDLEHDGDVDVVVGVSGQDSVWINDGGGSFVNGVGGLGMADTGEAWGVAAADIDGDGDLDVLISRSGVVHVNHNARPGLCNWVKVRPVTSDGAASAFGCSVVVTCVVGCSRQWVGLRVIDGGSSLYSQNAYDAHFGIPFPNATYNISVRWPGDFHPLADWTSHPSLGGIVPSSRPAVEDRLFVIRPVPVLLSVGYVLPWDYPGVTVRAGEGSSTPSPNDTVVIPIEVSPPHNARDLSAVSVAVNGQDVTSTWTRDPFGGYNVTYTTVAGDEDWPWRGLEIEASMVDSGGLVSSLSTHTIPGSTWSEESGARGNWYLTPGRGVCMGDVDGDGDLDVLILTYDGHHHQLWVNDGLGRFTEEAAARGVAGNTTDNGNGCTFGDIDGDGDIDVFVARREQNINDLYVNAGDGYFTEEALLRGVRTGDYSVTGAWGDVDGDGDIDLHVCNDDGRSNMLYVNDGVGVFGDEAAAWGVASALNCRQTVWLDVNDDGNLDVLVANGGGQPMQLFVNRGVGVFVDEGGELIDVVFDGNARAVSLGDVNGDGAVDVHVTSVEGMLLLNDGAGVFRDSGSLHVGPTATVMLDLEHDGDVDIFSTFRMQTDMVWVNAGTGSFRDVAGVLGFGSGQSWGAAAGDIDGDGDLDVVVARSGVYVNHNAQPGLARSLMVRPLTASAGQSAFGSSVRVVCVDGCESDWAGLRVIDGGSGYQSQNGYDAHFGLTDVNATYNISVRWPGDFRPISNWTSHPALGGVVPSLRPAVEDRLFVVRPEPVSLSVGFVLPWDYPGVTVRVGKGPSAPVAGDTVVIPITASPPHNARDLSAMWVTVNGQDVTSTWIRDSFGGYNVTYTTAEGDEKWPWAGLEIEAKVVDSGGLVSSVLKSTALSGSTLSEESDARGMAASTNPAGRGVCMGDADGDGDVDVFVAMVSGVVSQLWINDGSGEFTDEAMFREVAGSPSDHAHGCGFADADDDGQLDLFVTLYSIDVNKLYMNTGTTFSEDGAARGVSAGDDKSRGVSWGDVDGDGDVDLFVCNHNNVANLLFMNNGAGVFAEEGGSRGVGALTRSSQQSVLADIDLDGDLDVLVVNAGNANELYLNDGGGHFMDALPARGFSDGSHAIGIAVGDWSGDGVADVFVTNWNSRDLLYMNDGSGVFVELGVGAGVGASTGASAVVAMCDMDADGDVDIVVGVDAGPDSVWINDAGAFSEGSARLSLGSLATSWGLSVGDIDGDGDEDVMMGTSGLLYVNHNAQLAVPRVVVVRALTTGGSQSAFGASARVQCVAFCVPDWVGLHVFDGGSSFYSQNAYDAHFGIPFPSATYNISVRWPGDFHPISNWTTHPRLGSVIPSLRPAVEDRLFVVSPYTFSMTVSAAHPTWDYPGVTARLGDGQSPPTPSDAAVINVTLSPPPPSPRSLQPFTFTATVNGHDASRTWTAVGGGLYTLTYDSPEWPWEGLEVFVSFSLTGVVVSASDKPPVPGSTLDNVAVEVGLNTASMNAGGLCTADFDGDGFVDFLIAMPTGSPHQLWMSGEQRGSFYVNEAGTGLDGTVPDDATGCAAGDLDANGAIDVVITAADGSSQVMLNNGSSRFSTADVTLTGNCQASTVGDVDGDGDLDVVVVKDTAAKALLLNVGNGSFVDASTGSGVNTVRVSRAVALLDFSGDGYLDVLVVSDNSANEAFVNDGSGGFVLADVGWNTKETVGRSASIAVGDITGDGHLDIVVTRDDSDADVYVSTGTGAFTTLPPLPTDTSSSTAVATLDIELDGDLDIVLSRDLLPDLVFLNDGVGGFLDAAALLGMANAGPGALQVSAADADADGDLDLFMPGLPVLYRNFNARLAQPRWIRVHVTTLENTATAQGSTVRLTCATCPNQPWAAARLLDVTHVAHFGVPHASATYDISVTFPDGSTHDRTTSPTFGGVLPGSAIHVRNLPYVSNVTVSPAVPVVNVSTVISVTLTAGVGRTGLQAAPGCCLVNGIQTMDSFNAVGDGTYTLTYVVGADDAQWDANTLQVFAPLILPNGIASHPVNLTVTPSPAGDTIPPRVVFTCDPGPATVNTIVDLCVACPTEMFCTFSYTASPASQITAPIATTSPTMGTLSVGPYVDGNTVTVTVTALDPAGNFATSHLSWRVDTTPPTTELSTTPVPVSGNRTSRQDATFAFACSEVVCFFDVSVDDEPLRRLRGGNSTEQDTAAALETLVVAVPPPVTADANNTRIQFAVPVVPPNTTVTVAVTIDGVPTSIPRVGNTTEVVTLPHMDDGVHVITAAAEYGDASDRHKDVTPIEYAFTVDSRRPSVRLVRFPVDGDASSDPTVVFAADEAGCRFEWRAGPAGTLTSTPWNTTEVGYVAFSGVVGGTPHEFDVRAVDAAGNVGDAEAVEWTPMDCDGVAPPTVTITASLPLGPGVRFIDFEPESPWDVFEFRLDGGQWQAVPAGDTDLLLTTATLGTTHQVQVRAAGPAVCEAADPRSTTWVELPALPTVTITEHPPPSTGDVVAGFTFQASHPATPLEYRLDGREWTPCTATLRVGPLEPGDHTLDVKASTGTEHTSVSWLTTSSDASSVILTELADGLHTLFVKATDEAGNVEENPQTFVWEVDSTPPDTNATRLSPAFTSSTTARVAVECLGEAHPCTFCWESLTVPPDCTANTTLGLEVSGDGEHTVRVYAKDDVGLRDPSPVEAQWTVDSTPPVVGLVDVQDVLQRVPSLPGINYVLARNTLTLNLTVNEVVPGFSLTRQGVVWPPGMPLITNTTVTLSNLEEGVLNVTATASDRAGNVPPFPVTMVVWVDTLPPVTVWTQPPPPATNVTDLVVGVAATDAGGTGVVGILVNVTTADANITVWVPSSNDTATLSGLTSGLWNVSATSFDAAGNVDTSPVWTTVDIDVDPPESSLGVALPPVSGSASVSVAVQSSEPAVVFARLVGNTTSPWVEGNSSGLVALDGLPDGPNTLEIKSIDAAGNEEVPPYTRATLVVDTVPPVLNVADPVPPPYTNDPQGTACVRFVDATAVTFTPTVPAAISVTDDVACATLTANSDGLVQVGLTATDAGGHTSGDPVTAQWVLDRHPPTGLITSTVADVPACVTVDDTTVCPTTTAASITMSCVDTGDTSVALAPCYPQYALTTVQLATGSACPAAGTSAGPGSWQDAGVGVATTLKAPGDGFFSVAVRGVDRAGNTQPSNTSLSWHVDTVRPAGPTLEAGPQDFVSSDTAVVRAKLVGDISPGRPLVFHFVLDGMAPVPVDGEVTSDVQAAGHTFSGVTVGKHTVEVFAVDQAGNEGAPVTSAWEVINAAPAVVMLQTPASVSGDSTPDFVFAARWLDRTPGNNSEPQASVEVSMDGAAEYTELCADTVATGGLCVWNHTLPGVGEYTINVRSKLGTQPGNPTPFAWSYIVCDDDTFAVIGSDGGIKCETCPSGGNCGGGLTTQAGIAAQQGYWAPSTSSGLRFYECPVPEACLPGGEDRVGNTTQTFVSQCADGYVGTLCAVCDDGYFGQFGRCSPCETSAGVAWLITAGIVAAVAVVGVVVFRFRDALPKDQLKVTLSMAQVIASANTAYSIPWPPVFTDFLNVMRVFLVDAVSMTRASCAQPMSFYGSLVVTLIGFKLVLVVVVAAPVVLHKVQAYKRRRARQATGAATPQRRPSRPRRASVVQSMVAAAHAVQAVNWAQVFQVTFLFLFVAYPGVSLKIMKTFKCVEVDGTWWLEADMRLTCYTDDWYGYATYAFVMACLYTAGLPLAVVIILWRNRHRLGDPAVVAKWGFLYETYGTHAYLWEAVELVRKLWLTALVVLMAEGSPLQVTVAVLISGWAHVLHALYKPWRGVGAGGDWVYALQHGSLFVTFFVFLMGLLFKVHGVGTGSTTYDAVSWVMVLVCVAFLVFAVVVLVLAGRDQVRRVKARAAMKTATVNTSRRGTAQTAALWRGSGRRLTAAAVPPTAATASGTGSDRAVAPPASVRSDSKRDIVSAMSWVRNPLRRNRTTMGPAPAQAGDVST